MYAGRHSRCTADPPRGGSLPRREITAGSDFRRRNLNGWNRLNTRSSQFPNTRRCAVWRYAKWRNRQATRIHKRDTERPKLLNKPAKPLSETNLKRGQKHSNPYIAVFLRHGFESCSRQSLWLFSDRLGDSSRHQHCQCDGSVANASRDTCKLLLTRADGKSFGRSKLTCKRPGLVQS